MRQLIFTILLVGFIGLVCGPKVTETTPTYDENLRISGKVLYADSTGTGAPAVWVVYGFQETDSTPKSRLDSVMTDTLGNFQFTGVERGELHFEIYREPRWNCFGGLEEFTVLYNKTDMKLYYLHRPDCDNFWPPDTTDSM